MKLRNFYLATLCVLSLNLMFTACSDDDDDAWKDGATVELNQKRAFILNEGSMGYNNSNLIYFDWSAPAPAANCIYTQQNGRQLGDTGNDIITFDGKMAVAVNGSNYVALLNGSAVELSRVSFANGVDGTAVQVRNLVYDDGALYVTTYGGMLLKVRVSGNTLTFKNEYVNIGANLEGICEEDDKLYCVVAGTYPNNDSRIAIVPENNFTTSAVTYADVMYNPDQILEVDDHIYVQGYGSAYDYPFGEYNAKTGKYTQIGNATAWGADDDREMLYIANSVTDWSTYLTSTSLSAYNVKTGVMNDSFFTNVPDAVGSTFVYSISVNPYNGDIFMATSDYVTDGTIYQFDSKGAYKASFTAGGLNPNKIVFLR
ncbi:MAG: hypothetical protein K6A32_03355 [Bacteroidales bacterium]|nr:hypothetical protein [Bacteroidales bacterium]